MAGLCGVLGATLLMLLLGAGQARAATNVYPAGSGTFTGGAQGWEATEARLQRAGALHRLGRV